MTMGLLEAHAGLAGRTAVVVGGAYGIGRAVTLGLAAGGVEVACCDCDEEAVAAITGEAGALGVKVFARVADVCDALALDAFYDEVEQRFESADILVNVAGGVRNGPFMETTAVQNARDIRLNYGYVIDSIKRAVPLIRKGGRGGSIINFTTIEAHRGAAGFAVYAGAKAATTNFSKALAVELGADRIRVNLIAPDTTPSRTNRNAMPDDYRALQTALRPETKPQGMAMYIPLMENPKEDDLVNAVLFLASDLSRMVTGTTIHVDGGTIASLGFIRWPHGDRIMPVPGPESLKRLFETDEKYPFR